MSPSNLNQRFLESTRGRIVTLLRRSNRTVEELAQELALTDNAVRAHLLTLERDGIVHQRGARRGSGKPSYVYELTPEAEYLFPKAYGPVLHQLLDVLSEQMSPEEMEIVLRKVGRSIATKWNIPPGDLRTRLDGAVEVLNELGGMAELEAPDEHTYRIRGYSCPLAAAVPGHPEVCRLAETLITELVGVPVQEQCENDKAPRCCFTVPNT
ncbi:MAG: ArsR family transcriptional regulator [Chloroflexi bacterium]|nr:MAG: ArsR family transcriptional regulator [Chloroflexota bacterium]